jgi:hypothetical protein
MPYRIRRTPNAITYCSGKLRDVGALKIMVVPSITYSTTIKIPKLFETKLAPGFSGNFRLSD